jgi:hypothetical protein
MAQTSKPTVAEFIDEERIDTDYRYRYRYLSKAINFTSQDVEIIQRHKEFIAESVTIGVREIVETTLKFSPTRKLHLARIEHFKYKKEFVSDPDELTMESEQVVARIELYTKFLKYAYCGIWDDFHAESLVSVCAKGWGNKSVPVASIYDTISLSNMLLRIQTNFLENETIPKDEQKRLLLAFHKIGMLYADIVSYAEKMNKFYNV